MEVIDDKIKKALFDRALKITTIAELARFLQIKYMKLYNVYIGRTKLTQRKFVRIMTAIETLENRTKDKIDSLLKE